MDICNAFLCRTQGLNLLEMVLFPLPILEYQIAQLDFVYPILSCTETSTYNKILSEHFETWIISASINMEGYDHPALKPK